MHAVALSHRTLAIAGPVIQTAEHELGRLKKVGCLGSIALAAKCPFGAALLDLRPNSPRHTQLPGPRGNGSLPVERIQFRQAFLPAAHYTKPASLRDGPSNSSRFSLSKGPARAEFQTDLRSARRIAAPCRNLGLRRSARGATSRVTDRIRAASRPSRYVRRRELHARTGRRHRSPDQGQRSDCPRGSGRRQ